MMKKSTLVASLHNKNFFSMIEKSGQPKPFGAPLLTGEARTFLEEGRPLSPSTLNKRLVKGLRKHFEGLIFVAVSAALLYPIYQFAKKQTQIKQRVQAGEYNTSFERCGQAALEELQRNLRAKIAALQAGLLSAETTMVTGDGSVKCTATIAFQPKPKQDGGAKQKRGVVIPKEEKESSISDYQ